MDDRFEQFIEKTKSVRLTDEEKSRMKWALLSYIENEPVIKEQGVRLPYKGSLTQYLILRFTESMPIILILALLASGGTALAAQNSLPGDVLYPVKIHINENVRSLFAFSNNAQAKLQAELAVTRLMEAEKLAAENKLDATTTAMLQANFSDHSQLFQKEVDSLKNRSDIAIAAIAASDFETKLKAHEKILHKLGEDTEDIRSIITPLITDVRIDSSSTSATRVELEDQISGESHNNQSEVKKEAEERAQQAQDNLNKAIQLFNSQKSSFDATTTAQIQADLNAVQIAIADGNAQLSAGNNGNAFVDFARANRIAQIVKILLNTNANGSLNFNLHLNNGIRIEDNEEGEHDNEIYWQNSSSTLKASSSIIIRNSREEHGSDNSGIMNGIKADTGVNVTSSINIKGGEERDGNENSVPYQGDVKLKLGL